MTPFGVMLARHVHSQGWTLTEAASRISIDLSYLSKICKGARKPPLKHVRDWAVTLRVPSRLVDEFMLMAELEHAPEIVRKRWREQEAQINELEQKIGDLEMQMKAHNLEPKPMAKVADKRNSYGAEPPTT